MKKHVGNGCEGAEQEAVAAWLDFHSVLWFHAPNESRSSVAYRVKQARRGLKAGVPDVLIFDRPPLAPSLAVGVAIELKAPKTRTRRPAPTTAQRLWLRELANRGWLATVCYGARPAISMLALLGYGKRRPFDELHLPIVLGQIESIEGVTLFRAG